MPFKINAKMCIKCNTIEHMSCRKFQYKLVPIYLAVKYIRNGQVFYVHVVSLSCIHQSIVFIIIWNSSMETLSYVRTAKHGCEDLSEFLLLSNCLHAVGWSKHFIVLEHHWCGQVVIINLNDILTHPSNIITKYWLFLSVRKKTYVTATTGMARLQYKHGMKIHHWSGYGDDHLPANRLVDLILTNPGYAMTKERILECEVLIIDEIGLLSVKAFDAIEQRCGSVRNVDQAFGGIRLIYNFSNYHLSQVFLIQDYLLFNMTNLLKHYQTKCI